MRSLFIALMSVCAAAHAAPPVPGLDLQPSEVLVLSASASAEVANDRLTVVLSATREGADAAGVQSALKAALDAALAEARRAAKPGQVELQTGNFTLFPRHAPKGGGITGWQGHAELIVEGRDAAAIAQLSGRITTMTIARVGHSLSREQREKVEADLAAQAIARYRAKAAEYAKQFGYGSFVVREVSVSTSEPPGVVPVVAMRSQAMAAGEQALPVEAGKATVTVTVSGSVQMSR